MLRNVSILLFLGTLILVPIVMVGVSIESNVHFSLIMIGYFGTLIFSLSSAIKKDKRWLFVSLLFLGFFLLGATLDDQDRQRLHSNEEMGMHPIDR